MQVRVGSTLSDLYDQEQGVPQGGVLSTTLFNIKINDIVKCLDNLTDCSLYVDDFCICFRSKKNLYESKPNFIKSFGVRILPVLESANINFNNIDKTFTPNVPAWCINKPKLLFDLHSSKPRSDSTTLPWSLGHTSHLGTILIVILVPIRECQE